MLGRARYTQWVGPIFRVSARPVILSGRGPLHSSAGPIICLICVVCGIWGKLIKLRANGFLFMFLVPTSSIKGKSSGLL